MGLVWYCEKAIVAMAKDMGELEELSDESIEEMNKSLKCPANLMQPLHQRLY